MKSLRFFPHSGRGCHQEGHVCVFPPPEPGSFPGRKGVVAEPRDGLYFLAKWRFLAGESEAYSRSMTCAFTSRRPLLAACILAATLSVSAWGKNVPFDLGLPPFDVLMQSLPKWGDNLVEVNVSRERYDILRNEEKKNKPPQIYSSPVLMPAAWPRELKRDTLEAVFSFSLDADGTIRDIQRLSEVHPALERVAMLYIARLRYSPAELEGKHAPARAELTLRFQTDGLFPD